jgi:hypothetical protein
MIPADFRNATWDKIQERIEGLRLTVYEAWQKYGPGTTREVAARAQIDLLTFRPRSTELFQLGLLRLVEREHNHEHQGIYEAVPMAEARAAHERALFAPRAEQFLMPLDAENQPSTIHHQKFQMPTT